jgi:hypothetical protein
MIIPHMAHAMSNIGLIWGAGPDRNRHGVIRVEKDGKACYANGEAKLAWGERRRPSTGGGALDEKTKPARTCAQPVCCK